MSATGPQPEKQSAAPAGRGPRWDDAALQTHHGRLATATSTSTEIVVNVGTTHSDSPASAISVRLLARIAMTPLTAKRLHDMLGRLIPPQEAGGPRATGNG